MKKRKTILVYLEPELLRRIERWTKNSQKKMGRGWSRNDQILWILGQYTEPEEADER